MRNAISVLLQPLPQPQPQPPPLLPIINAVDHHHMLQILQNHTLGIPALMISATAEVSLACSDVNFLARNYIMFGFALAIAFLLPGIFLGKIYLQGLGIVLCVLSLFAFLASALPIAFACAVGICGAVCIGAILYTLIKHHQAA